MFLKLKKLLGDPIPMYLVPLKRGNRWSLRKKPEKGREFIKGLFFPRAWANPESHPKTGYFFPENIPEKQGDCIYFFEGRCRLGNNSNGLENQEKETEVVSFTYKNGQLVRVCTTDENGRVISVCFYDDDQLAYKFDYDEQGRIRKTFYDEKQQERGFLQWIQR
jgi:hypothetical protein